MMYYLKKISLLIMLCSVLVLTGCLSNECANDLDTDHCLQDLAKSSGKATHCEKIKGDRFQEMGINSNPPKDKCYIMLAAQEGDYSLCKKVKGGEMSYTKEDCYMEVINTNLDPAGCERLKKSDRYQECLDTFSSSDTIVMKDYRITDLQEILKNAPEDEQAQKELAELQARKDKMFAILPEAEKSKYLQEQREKIMENVVDDEVKSAISKEVVAFKQTHPDATVSEIVTHIQQSTNKQQALKRVDIQANSLIDNLKEQMMTAATDELSAQAMSMGTDWLKENGGDELTYQLERLERLKEGYDTASEEFAKLQEQYEKIKNVYDEIQAVAKKMDEFDTLVKQGKIDEGKAQVLKGGLLLHKGLNVATSYVPIFGDTISTVTDETFKVAMELAEKRAQRSTALEKCFDDPLNCDTDNISGY